MPKAIAGSWGSSTVTPKNNSKPVNFEPKGKTKFDIKEASDVCALPGGRMVIVGDTSDKIGVIDANGKMTKIQLPGLKGASQMEAVTYDPVKHHLIVSREESRELMIYEWDPAKSKAPELKRKVELKNLDGAKNKGVEGMAYLDGHSSPTGRPQILLAKEGNPKTLELVDDKGGGKSVKVELEEKVTKICKDFSAVTVDPKTGNLFISSDESSTVAQLKLVREKGKIVAKLIHSFPLRDGGKPLARVEGLTFDSKGDLRVLTENDGALHTYKRQ